jgi:lycopene cyclase domain-containing protein
VDFYIVLDIIVISGPLLLSFDRKVAFYKKWPAVFGAIAVVIIVYGLWDVWMASRGIWSFNPEYSGNFKPWGLPLGEWLFFVAVPYACLFILACVRAYFKEKLFPVDRRIGLLVTLLFGALAIVFLDRAYTATVFLSVALIVAAGLVFSPETFGSSSFYLAMLISYVPFAIANGILTGKPVVLYDNNENLAFRIGTIPVEDFFYSFSMLALAIIAYDMLSLLHLRRTKPKGNGGSAR